MPGNSAGSALSACYTLAFASQLRKEAWKKKPHSGTTGALLSILYRVSQEECARLRESVPYVKVYRYNPKHLYPKLNGYGDNGLRKVGGSCGSKYCNLHS